MADKRKTSNILVCESQEVLYQRAIKKMNADRLIVQFAYKIENYETAAVMFDEVGDYEDARELAKRCRRLAEEARGEEKKDLYRRAMESRDNAQSEQEYERVAEAFGSLGDYGDASQKERECRDVIRKMQTKRRRNSRDYSGSCYGWFCDRVFPLPEGDRLLLHGSLRQGQAGL